MASYSGWNPRELRGGRGIVIRVVADVVGEVAPEELPLIRALNSVGYADAVRRLRRARTRKEPLGFGLEEVTALVTAVVWIAVDEVLRESVNGVRQRVANRLRTLLRRPAPEPVVLPLTREQLASVHARVRELSVEAGLAEERAGQIADSVVARLALELPPNTTPPEVTEG